MQIGNILSTANNQYLKNAAYATNYQSASKQAEQIKTGDAARTDTATFSIKPQRTQASDFIKGLMEQKQSLQEQKQKLMENAKETGGSDSTLREQLDALNKQIEEINEQMVQQMASSLTAEANSSKNKSPNPSKSNPDGMGELITAANSLENAKVITKVSGQVERAALVLETEIKLDESIAHKPDITLATSAKKPGELAEMKNKASQLQETAGEQVSEATKIVSNGNPPSESDLTESQVEGETEN